MAVRVLAFALLVHHCTAVSPYSLAPHEQAVVDGVNATLGARAAGRLHYELMLPSIATNSTINKDRIVAIMFLGFNFFGVDRMMFGQIMVGVVKLVLGVAGVYVIISGNKLGNLLLIWGFADHFVMLWNALTKAESMHVLGFNAIWEPDTIQTAFYYGILVVLNTAANMVSSFTTRKELESMDRMNASLRGGPLRGREAKPEDADYKLLDV